jgi:hypothetical protein
MSAKITMARMDNRRHMQEQPALFLLFKIASRFCTLCSQQIFQSILFVKKDILKYEYLFCKTRKNRKTRGIPTFSLW